MRRIVASAPKQDRERDACCLHRPIVWRGKVEACGAIGL